MNGLERTSSLLRQSMVSGVELDIAEDSPLAEGGRRPIHMCQCVIEPCDCPGLIWVHPDDILSRESTQRTNRAGEYVSEFRIDPDATVLVESVVRAKVSALQTQPEVVAQTRESLAVHQTWLRLRRPEGARENRAPGAYYGGQECAGHTLYEVWEETMA